MLVEERIHSDATVSADAVIIGSGAGGATTAHLLTKAGLEVVIVEEGGYHSTESFDGEVGELVGRLYRDAGLTPILGKPNIAFGEGCCLGGSTVVNGALCWRTPLDVLETWSARYGLPCLAESDMVPFFEAIERDLSISTHPRNGANQTSERLIAGCEALGWRWEPVPRAQVECANSNRCPTGCPNGAKQSMLVTYLPRAAEQGARIFCNARAAELIMSGRRCLGIKAIVDSGEGQKLLTVYAPNVFIAGGPIQTPYLLLKNGFKTNVGRNLQIHLNFKVAALFDRRVDPRQGTMMTAQVKEFASEKIYIGGSNFDPVYLAVTLAAHGRQTIERVLEQWPRSAIYLAQIKGAGKGLVRDLGLGRPIVSYNLVDGDLQRIRSSIHRLVSLLVAAGAEEVYLPIPGSPVIRSVGEVESFLARTPNLRAVDLLSVHATSTCPLGSDPRRAALDPFGRLRGTDNVYVCDASMLPEAPGVNPQVSIMAMVHRNISHFLDEAPGPGRSVAGTRRNTSQRGRVVFVTGGSGFVGRGVVGALADEGWVVRALLLPGEVRPFDHPSVDWIGGDILKPETLEAHLDGVTAVAHFAGVVASADEELNYRVNYLGAKNMVDAAIRAGVKRFMYMSAAAVKFKTANAYGRTKRQAEEYVAASGLAYDILRTPLIIGRGCQEFERFVEFVDAIPGVVPVFGDGSPIKRPIHISDVVSAVLAILTREPKNGVYEIACRREVTLDEFIDAVAASLNRRKYKLHIPLGLSLFMAGAAEKLLGRRSPVTRDILLGLNEDVDFDIEESLAQLDLAPLSLEDALDRWVNGS